MCRIVNYLLKEKKIPSEEISFFQNRQSTRSEFFDRLIRLGYLTELDYLKAIEKVWGFPCREIQDNDVKDLPYKYFSYEKAKELGILPIEENETTVSVAMSNPLDVFLIDDITRITKKRVRRFLSTSKSINEAIEKCYSNQEPEIPTLDETILGEGVGDIEVFSDEEIADQYNSRNSFDVQSYSKDDSKVIKLLNGILYDAVCKKATDIHIEPREKYVDIRYRIEGGLKHITKLPNFFREGIVTRIKVLTDLNISERRKSQDGRRRLTIGRQTVDARISVVPTFFGEKVALRLLYLNQSDYKLSEVIIQDEVRDSLVEAISKPQGFVLVTGPTGSGKTTTLYSCINHIRQQELTNIVTIEDPVEYVMDEVNQIQVNPIKGLTFANCLRTVLRLDPNVILVGEIRDQEKADVAFRSSLTGHLVLSTLHTRNAVATITRLYDMGLEPYLVASSLSVVIAQRLIKLNCQHCLQSYLPKPGLLEKFKNIISLYDIKIFYKGGGCEKCHDTGYSGREAIFEVLNINESIRELINQRANGDQLFYAARENGMKTLIESGVERVAKGMTTLEEIINVANVADMAAINKSLHTDPVSLGV